MALGKGYPALSWFVVDAAAGRAMLSVPAHRIAEHLGMLPVDPGLAS